MFKRVILPLMLAGVMKSGVVVAEPCDGGCGPVSQEQYASVAELKRQLRGRSLDVVDTYNFGVNVGSITSCVDSLMDIDLSVLTIDPLGTILEAVTGLQDKILNAACRAATSWVSAQTNQLNNVVNEPSERFERRLRNVGISVQSSRDRVSLPPLSEEELERRAGDSVYEDVAPPPIVVRGAEDGPNAPNVRGRSNQKLEAKQFKGLDSYFKNPDRGQDQ